MKNCAVCDKVLIRNLRESFHYYEKRKYCSLDCYYKVPKPKAEQHPAWKGGRTNHGGYVRVYNNGQRILEHRLVMEQMLGRPMLPTETVHHKNGIRSDNRPENLELRVGQHGKGATIHCPTCKCEVN